MKVPWSAASGPVMRRDLSAGDRVTERTFCAALAERRAIGLPDLSLVLSALDGTLRALLRMSSRV